MNYLTSTNSLLTWLLIVTSPFLFVQQPTFKEVIDFLRPRSSLALPSDYQVGHRLLKAAIKEVQEYSEELMLMQKQRGYYPSLVIDGWQDITHRHIEGVIIMYGKEAFDQESRSSWDCMCTYAGGGDGKVQSLEHEDRSNR